MENMKYLLFIGIIIIFMLKSWKRSCECEIASLGSVYEVCDNDVTAQNYRKFLEDRGYICQWSKLKRWEKK